METKKQWSENNRYSIQTKTLWYTANQYFRNTITSASRWQRDQSEFLKNEMIKMGYSNLTISSVEMFLGALNGTMVGTQLKKTPSLQDDVNTFRKSIGLPKISF